MRNDRSNKTNRYRRWLAVGALLAASACAQNQVDRTSLEVEVRSAFLPGVQVDEVRITVTVNRPVERSFSLDEEHPFPVRVGITPARTSSEEVLIEVAALKSDNEVASSSLKIKFEPGVVRTVIIELNDQGAMQAPRPVDGGAPLADASSSCQDGATVSCACGSDRGMGLKTCSGGAWLACKATCADTGLVGSCAAGTRLCDETQPVPGWGACSLAPATADSCEMDADENCNGIKNEGCPCTQGAKRSCGDAGLFGACAAGSQTCSAQGAWETCTLAPKPQDTCAPGNDDNCNGAKNEGCECVEGATRTCGAGGLSGRCAAGTQTCSAVGKWDACSIQALAKDTCVDGNDDNCNGRPNEGCPCLAGTERTCGSGGAQGRCAFGMQRCSPTGQWSSCSVEPAQSDSCSTASNDDNCNGIKAEGCACVAGSIKCNGSKSEECSQDGRNVKTEDCANAGCDLGSGKCRGECTPGSRRCKDGNAELCSSSRLWTLDRACESCEGDVCRDCGEEGQRACWNEDEAMFSLGGTAYKTCVALGPHRVWSDASDCNATCDPDPAVCQ